MLWDKITQQNTDVWTCQGGKDDPHPIEYNNSEKCIQCGRSRQGVSDEQKPQKDNLLLAALTILNLGSGITTMLGAAQIFPRFLGYSSGAVIQVLLFLLVSGSTLKSFSKLKWLTVGSLSIISVYTSFFAYYDTLVGQERKQKTIEQATVAHQKLVREVYAPIEQKSDELESEVKTITKRIEQEIKGNRESGLPGCGEICKNLKNEREALEAKIEKLKPTVIKLQPLFEYELENKSPWLIFKTDIKALGQVPPDCLPEDPAFDCLPQGYESILDPNSPQYKQLRDSYFDGDARYILLEPYHKITKGEPPAIAAALLALMVDGLIIALGTAVEQPQQQTGKKVTLQLLGTGSAFLNKLMTAIDEKSLTINDDILQQDSNSTQYKILLETIRIRNKWVKTDGNQKGWKITDLNAYDQFFNWLINERERHLEAEKPVSNKKQKSDEISDLLQPRNVIFLLPSQSYG
ncbi:MAG: hypothetical protein WA919_12220 [Coleofasciculaceae cyanobacterium]